MEETSFAECEFALCLTHDVDRPYKTYQSVYNAVRDGDPSQLRSLLPGVNPYWQFEEIMDLEAELGVRSAFYFLNEQRIWERPLSEWLDPETWKLYAGRYSISDPDIVQVMRRLDEGGWEVGLHGSYESYADPDRLREEKAALESVLGHSVEGVRQHYLNLETPETWRYQSEAGLRYDTSLGSSTTYGFEHGYDVLRPFDDEFVVFPLTVMENALPDPGEQFEDAWSACRSLLREARREGAVMTVLWHPNKFSERDYPGYRRLYRRVVERAAEMGAWIGPPGDLYERLAVGDARGIDDRSSGVDGALTG